MGQWTLDNGQWTMANGAHRALSFIIYHLSFIILHFSFFIFMSCPFSVQAQDIVIGGYVYGGGNKGKVAGNTTVRVEEGDIDRVYGGARLADVGGRAFVKIESKENTAILINQAFGGNDISGHIGTYNGDMAVRDTVPSELIHVKRVAEDATDPKKNAIDKTWNALVQIKGNAGAITETDGNTKNALLIGSLYAGGNGNYDYDHPSEGVYYIYEKDHKVDDTPIAISNTDFNVPELGKAYLEIVGGSIGQAFGGGNNATVTENTVIYVDNPTKVVNSIKRAGVDISNTAERAAKMDINPGYTYMSSDAFQIGNFFGGNNKADMDIMPQWNLQSGLIRNLYSGGNQGNMIHEKGLLLEINPAPMNGTDEHDVAKNDNPLIIDNVYGGCRMADVRPMKKNDSGVYEDLEHVYNLDNYFFPDELAARTLIRGGDVNNVYGGNDIRGRVYFGNAIGVYASIRGNLYGGGNGDYPYTDNAKLQNDRTYGDLYYVPGASSVDALNNIRPNAEQVSIRVAGTETKPTIIHGSVYCGGNNATLKTDPVKLANKTKYPNYPMVELKIGSHVIADNVFLGNNGENMMTTNEATAEKREGTLRTMANTTLSGNDTKFSSINLKDPDTFAKYMDGVSMDIIPAVVYDNVSRGDPATYIPYTSWIGSAICGGNRGSMTYPGTNTTHFNAPIYIYNKVVGGSLNTYIPETEFNARYEGGILGSADERASYTDGSGKIKDRIVMNFNGTRIRPKRWAMKKDGSGNLILDGEGNPQYDTDINGNHYLEWNTAKWVATTSLAEGHYEEIGTGSSATPHTDETEEEDAERRLLGGNVYGGCYNSGNVNGNVVINISSDVIERDELFADTKNKVDGSGNPILGDDHEPIQIIDDTGGKRNSGVILGEQSFDVLTLAMSIFGAGYGSDTEVWGSTTVNLNEGYCFQIYGGGEKGIVGKPIAPYGSSTNGTDHFNDDGTYETNFKKFEYNEAYSTHVNLKGDNAGYPEDEEGGVLAETEYIYGGGNEGDVCGSSYVNLGNGRIYDSFGGASDANILGHAETYVGRNGIDASGNDILGFPYVRDIVYGGNDFGGKIRQDVSFADRVRKGATESERNSALAMIHARDENSDGIKDVLKATSYVEYRQGHVDYQLYGGCYGDYDYTDPDYKPTSGRPDISSSFVNLRPTTHHDNFIPQVLGGNEGHAGDREGDKMLDRSYVLVDIPDNYENFRNTEIFGAGSNNGLGMLIDKDELYEGDTAPTGPAYDGKDMKHADAASAIIDLISGQIGNVYGGSYNEGITRRTVVNVPDNSTINANEIYGGAYGTQILPPCDVYVANVNYRNTSEKARVKTIFGGNNNERRALFTRVNISSPVWSDKDRGYLGSVYGAGRGVDTWSEFTEVNLLSGARVYEVYGGGQLGHVLNSESVQQYMQLYKDKPSPQISKDDPKWSNPDRWDGEVGTGTLKTGKLVESDEKTIPEEWAEDWADAWTFGDYFTPNAGYTNYVTNDDTNKSRLVPRAELDDKTAAQLGTPDKKFNAKVIINEGATVVNYAYGGGWGEAKTALSGDVYGTTYVALLGGEVKKDIYAAGTAGGVTDLFGSKNFTASANVFIKGGTCRNVYGGGWRGSVGHAVYTQSVDPIYSSASETIYEQIPNFWDNEGNYTDIPGETHVVIGLSNGNSHTNGIPSVTRNVYGGGEGGGIYGTANVFINNGYIGYRYNGEATDNGETTDFDERYVAELDDAAPGDNLLDRGGNVFGGGYVANSYVDNSDLKMYGGIVRGSLYGGGEIGPIGRGTMKDDARTFADRSITDAAGATIYKAGKTHVQLYDGWVQRDVFGGGRGYDNWGGEGYMTEGEKATMDRSAKGYVFGQTEVDIYGGEVGTEAGLKLGYGNVFGGGDIGFVHSAYEKNGKLCIGKKSGVRYNVGLTEGQAGYNDDGFYYKYENGAFLLTGSEKILTEDCKVLIEPHPMVTSDSDVSFTGITYPKNATLPYEDLTYLQANADTYSTQLAGIDTNGKVIASGGITFNRSYAPGEHVSMAALNTLNNKNESRTTWEAVGKTNPNKDGIIIHNAVFAGGNTQPGSTIVYASTTTVFGNATASINDAYHRDLITVGTGRVGGLYGDGNLTLVDGYRELNITNYGTDFYSIKPEITLEQYNALPDREGAYYEIRYRCAIPCKANNGRTYSKGSTISADEMLKLFAGVTVAKYDVQYEEDGKTIKLDANGYPIATAGSGTYNMLQDNGHPQPAYWVENGVCSRYAGRLMNTIQRADFCGVFGSRMVMQGAQDRVPTTVDYTHYTINRVREVSLNKKVSVISGDAGTDRAQHGNYFGIYNVVNYLGALTSDVDFADTRKWDNADTETYGPAVEKYSNGDPIELSPGNPKYIGDDFTYYDWKSKYHNEKKRNNGTSENKVALASGVYLELTTELSTGPDLDDKDWGYITGVVELDLINVQQGLGGGFVYAKNEHGLRSPSGLTQTTLTALNDGAITRKKYTYANPNNSRVAWQTSGNFVHSTKTIVDDCYNIGGKYKIGDWVPAHYWFIKGSVYIYDQYISAYTGSPNAYTEHVNIPLTITSASHGRITLMEVQPNYYAYKSGATGEKLGPDDEIVMRDVKYKLNDPINYWDYSMLTHDEQQLFVPETYVITSNCIWNDTPLEAGTVLIPGPLDGSVEGTYNYYKKHAPMKLLEEGDLVQTRYVHLESLDKDVDFDEVFHPSNNLDHNTGFILTYKVNNPKQWDTWYTENIDAQHNASVPHEKIQDAEVAGYTVSPTYTPIESGLYGQRDYTIGNIISKDIVDKYDAIGSGYKPSTTDPTDPKYQAKFEPAYIVIDDILETTDKNDNAQRFYKYAALGQSDYTDAVWEGLYNEAQDPGVHTELTSTTNSIAPAYLVTSTIQLTETDYIYRGSKMTLAEKNKYKTDYPTLASEIDKVVLPAYYCYDAGKYGGDYYETGINYNAKDAFTALSAEDRQYFTFNYDALDLLIDSNYGRPEGMKYQYDGTTDKNSDGDITEEDVDNPAKYSLETSIDYTATYKGSTVFKYIDDNDEEQETKDDGTTILSNTEYERLPNEQFNYAPIVVKADNEGHIPNYYVVKYNPAGTLILGDTPYAPGQIIDQKTYAGLSETDQANVTILSFENPGTYYFCRKNYTINDAPYAAEEKAYCQVTSASDVTGAVSSGGTLGNGDEVPSGVVITKDNYEKLINMQKDFAIHGTAPTETSTLYVPTDADINDLSAEKIITVVYKYDYVESDMSGMNIEPYSERHVLNIHINFRSGMPEVEDIQAPDIILPGTTVSIMEPYVTPGAYEVTGGGWELYDDELDAKNYTNGIEYNPNTMPLYLYQDKYYVAYYAKTYLGKTFSNTVPVSVANYHDIKKVMEDKAHHYYIDHKDIFQKKNILGKTVEPKIYINDYSKDETGNKNGLDLFKKLFDLSALSSPAVGSDGLISSGDFATHKPLNERVAQGNQLEFFLNSDLEHSDNPAVADEWTPIAGEKDGGDYIHCFKGTLHGDGHTVMGLDNSLFGKLCGDIYNLGVTGSFTSAGIAEEGDGYMENCWISTSSTATKTSMPVFGEPSGYSGGRTLNMVNCYYQEEDDAANKYTNHSGSYGIPTRKPAQSFYNGEVAYDLNGFYLYKRYNDNAKPGGTANYYYWLPGNDDRQTGTYASNPATCSAGSGTLVTKYVEDRYADGDFRYAGGTIPEGDDVHQYSYTVTDEGPDKGKSYKEFYPIWPDDYIFFGQQLNYDHVVDRTHQNKPSAIIKSDGTIDLSVDGNRVYRAPAYFRSKQMGVAHFNPYAVFAQSKKNDASILAYKDMTAIDFSGYNDAYEPNGTLKAFELGWQGSKFYPPLLDDDGISGFRNEDLTRNLLAYTATAAAENEDPANAGEQTAKVISTNLLEPVFALTDPNYKTVAYQSPSNIRGHWVQKVDNSYRSVRDQFLVDKQDFNAPISYTLNANKRMWYQRYPDDAEFVDRTKGWQSISLPFTAELVTTQQKGEITHFYGGSEESKNDTKSKIGHEYWLREFKGGALSQAKDANGDDIAKTYTANFRYPAEGSTTHDVPNTFLWDYYYNGLGHEHQDMKYDTYQTYYQTLRRYTRYPHLQNAKPYLLGLPGATYYEFDLSGNFEATTTAETRPEKLVKQYITFASTEDGNVTINVSDDETVGVYSDKDGSNNYYVFKPSYMNWTLAGNAVDKPFVISADGSSYDQVASDATANAVAFRPYFYVTATAPSSGVKKMVNNAADHIVFSNINDSFGEENEDEEGEGGALRITSRLRHIVLTSTLKRPRAVRIFTTSGIHVTTVTVNPGQTVEVPVTAPGIYIVNQTKLSVR